MDPVTIVLVIMVVLCLLYAFDLMSFSKIGRKIKRENAPNELNPNKIAVHELERMLDRIENSFDCIGKLMKETAECDKSIAFSHVLSQYQVHRGRFIYAAQTYYDQHKITAKQSLNFNERLTHIDAAFEFTIKPYEKYGS